MKSKILFLIIALAIPAKEYAQTPVNKTWPVRSGQAIVMHFDYPELIRVTTWEKNEISVTGSLSINGGENDDAFLLEGSTSGDAIEINARIKDIKKLPHRIVVTEGERKIMFQNKAELERYQQVNGKVYNSISWGPDIDIHLEIKVPADTETRITSVYGLVEVMSFAGPLTVESTYGGVDAALIEHSVGEVSAETGYGQIYTDLKFRFSDEQRRSRDFYTFVSAKPGTGPRYKFQSKYGNVYLRKASN